jgi:hypothetical protein
VCDEVQSDLNVSIGSSVGVLRDEISNGLLSVLNAFEKDAKVPKLDKAVSQDESAALQSRTVSDEAQERTLI